MSFAGEDYNSQIIIGTELHGNSKWNFDILRKISKCYCTLSTIKNFTPHIRKQLAESLILSALDYNANMKMIIINYKNLHRMKLFGGGGALNTNRMEYIERAWSFDCSESTYTTFM